MRIAIFGSWNKGRKGWQLRGSKGKFIKACKMLGRKISLHEHTVIVESFSLNTADRYITEGVIEEVKYKSIDIVRPPDDSIIQKLNFDRRRLIYLVFDMLTQF